MIDGIERILKEVPKDHSAFMDSGIQFAESQAKDLSIIDKKILLKFLSTCWGITSQGVLNSHNISTHLISLRS